MPSTSINRRTQEGEVRGTRLLVIGGGFAGCAAAASLRDQGASVTLLDDRRTLGGRARSDDFAGFVIDTGAQLVATSFTRTLGLLSSSRVGVWSAADANDDTPLHRVKGRDAYVRGDDRFPLQFGSVRSLLAFGGLGALEKLKLAAHLLPALTAHHAALDAAAINVPVALDADTARSYMATRVSIQAADVLVEPPLNGFYALRGSEASLAFYLMLGRYASDSDMLAPEAGWSRVLEAALHGVTCSQDVTVRELTMTVGGGVRALASDGREWSADGAVIATGPRSAAALLAPHLMDDDALLRWLLTIAMRPTWTLALALDVAPRRDAFGVFHDARHAQRVSACAVLGAKLRHPSADRDVVLAWPTPDAVRGLRDGSSEHIAAAMLGEIEALVPEVRGHVRRARVYRFDEGTPVAHPGFAADRVRGRALAAQIALPIALAGDYLSAPLIEGAVSSGLLAADLLMARTRARTRVPGQGNRP